jgi:hypothetical protein
MVPSYEPVAWDHRPERPYSERLQNKKRRMIANGIGRTGQWSKGCPGLYDWVNPSSLAVEA